MKTILKYAAIIPLLVINFAMSAYKTSVHSYILTSVKIECISQCDFTGSDQVFVTIPAPSINEKTSATRAFKPGNVKLYTEIGPNSGSGTTAWFIKPGDKISIYEKDLIDPDDLIRQISVTTAICNGQPQTVTGINGTGKYKITFTIAVI